MVPVSSGRAILASAMVTAAALTSPSAFSAEEYTGSAACAQHGYSNDGIRCEIGELERRTEQHRRNAEEARRTSEEARRTSEEARRTSEEARARTQASQEATRTLNIQNACLEVLKNLVVTGAKDPMDGETITVEKLKGAAGGRVTGENACALATRYQRRAEAPSPQVN